MCVVRFSLIFNLSNEWLSKWNKPHMEVNRYGQIDDEKELFNKTKLSSFRSTLSVMKKNLLKGFELLFPFLPWFHLCRCCFLFCHHTARFLSYCTPKSVTFHSGNYFRCVFLRIQKLSGLYVYSVQIFWVWSFSDFFF